MRNITVQKHIGIFLIVVTVLFYYSTVSYAAPQVAPIIIEQNREQQQQRELEANKRLNQRPSQKTPNIKIDANNLLAKDECRIITNVFTYGADLIPASDRNAIIKPVLKQCLDNKQITRIATQIQQWYLQNGFITTRVTIKQKQNSFLEKGNLEIWVIEGKVAAFILGDNNRSDNARIQAAFPLKTGDILSIQGLDQGLEQLNKLFSQQFKMKIKPASRPGYSDIILLEPTSAHATQQLTVTYNNGGVKSTGEDLYNLNYTKENLLGYNDILSVSWQRALPDDNNKNETIRINATIPYGYWNFNLNYNLGDTIRTITGSTLSFLSKSTIQTTQFSANQILYRSKHNKLENAFKVEYSDRKSYINDTQIETSSRQIANINYSLTYSHYFPNSTLILSPSLIKGMPLFGAITDSDTIQKSQPHAEYDVIKLYAYYRQHYLRSSRYSFSIQNSLNAQSSNTALYGEKQFVLGGEYSIRGFKENIISSDNGISLRNDLILPIGLWTLPWHKKFFLTPLSMSLFYDIGEAYPFVDGKRITLSGWGYSFAYNHKWFTASYVSAQSLSRADSAVNNENWVHYANISAKFVF